MAELAAETETLRNLYAALNRNDIAAVVTAFDPEIEWCDPGASASAGTYRGLENVTAHFSAARGAWAEGTCEPERFIVSRDNVGGDKIVVFVRVRVRLKHETEWREGQLADVYTFRNGRAVQARCFSDRHEALAWVGINAADVKSLG